jgi:hypothetical protein
LYAHFGAILGMPLVGYLEGYQLGTGWTGSTHLNT